MTETDQTQVVDAGAIWNPNAAANWSLVFTPAFGAYIHMLNWRSLGEIGLAQRSRCWFYISTALLVLYVLLSLLIPDEKAADGLARGIGVIFLFSWYFGSARAQAKYVKAKLGNSYERRPWGKPLGIAVLGLVGYFIAAALVGALLAVVIHIAQ